ncbi:hypothetical protein HDU96_011151 [Phlyctochytrium bullatum]|nr:hypothetical protein HDU96_011151 [Phlyctochytrium bullatum]
MPLVNCPQRTDAIIFLSEGVSVGTVEHSAATGNANGLCDAKKVTYAAYAASNDILLVSDIAGRGPPGLPTDFLVSGSTTNTAELLLVLLDASQLINTVPALYHLAGSREGAGRGAVASSAMLACLRGEAHDLSLLTQHLATAALPVALLSLALGTSLKTPEPAQTVALALAALDPAPSPRPYPSSTKRNQNAFSASAPSAHGPRTPSSPPSTPPPPTPRSAPQGLIRLASAIAQLFLDVAASHHAGGWTTPLPVLKELRVKLAPCQLLDAQAAATILDAPRPSSPPLTASLPPTTPTPPSSSPTSRSWSAKRAGDIRKKDVGLCAMTYENASVAGASLQANYAGVVSALQQAETVEGSAVVLAYEPRAEVGGGGVLSAVGV